MRLPISRLTALVAGSVAGACGGHAKTRPVDPLPSVTGTLVATSTLRFIDVKQGPGRAAVVGKCVYTHYTGYLGRTHVKVESSHDLTPEGGPGEPVGFLLGAKEVISGWDVGIAGMNVGGQRRLFLPYRAAYGTRGKPPAIPRNADLIFDIEVMAIADSLPHPRVASSSVSAAAPPNTCPSWRTVNAR